MRRCPPSRGSEGRGAACRLVAAGAGHRVPSARAEEGSLSEARGASVTPAPHARVLDEREPLPRRRRHAVLAQQVPRHPVVGLQARAGEARRDDAAAAAPCGCGSGRPYRAVSHPPSQW